MRPVVNEDLKRCHEVVNQVWQFIRAHMDTVQDTDEQWDQVLAEANAIERKYRGSEQGYMAKKLLTAVLLELQRKAKRGKVDD